MYDIDCRWNKRNFREILTSFIITYIIYMNLVYVYNIMGDRL